MACQELVQGGRGLVEVGGGLPPPPRALYSCQVRNRARFCLSLRSNHAACCNNPASFANRNA
jgi:hypothetical protein